MSAARDLRPSRRRNSRLVREHDRIQTRMLFWALAAGLVILVPLLANIWGHAETTRLGYRIEEARQAETALAERNRLLRAEHAALRDLGRVQDMAVHKLGLEPRRPSATVVVSIVESPGEKDGEQADTEGKNKEVVVADGEVSPSATTRLAVSKLASQGGQP